MKIRAFFFGGILLFGFASCSSAPKKPPEIFTLRNIAANQMELAGSMANRGRSEDALLIISDVKKTVTAVDDPQLIIRCGIVYGNILFSLGAFEDAFAEWDYSLKIALSENYPMLAALVRIYSARGNVVLMSLQGNVNNSLLEEIRSRMDTEISILKGDETGEAAGWITKALAEKELKSFNEAENSAQRALNIHDRGRYLEEAAYDWFLIASIRSVSGRLDDAINALQQAIQFDRRAENGYGLAASWKALGDVYTKKGDAPGAEESYRRASAIYGALGIEEFIFKNE